MKLGDLKITIDMDEETQTLLKETAADLREIKDLLKEIKKFREELYSKLQIKSSEVHDKLKKHFIPEDH